MQTNHGEPHLILLGLDHALHSHETELSCLVKASSVASCLASNHPSKILPEQCLAATSLTQLERFWHFLKDDVQGTMPDLNVNQRRSGSTACWNPAPHWKSIWKWPTPEAICRSRANSKKMWTTMHMHITLWFWSYYALHNFLETNMLESKTLSWHQWW